MSDLPPLRVTYPTEVWTLRRHSGVAMAFILGVLAGTVVTTEEAAASCSGERLDLTEPLVTVVAGPGDPVAEAALWSTFEYLQLEGPDEFQVNGMTVYLERSP